MYLDNRFQDVPSERDAIAGRSAGPPGQRGQPRTLPYVWTGLCQLKNVLPGKSQAVSAVIWQGSLAGGCSQGPHLRVPLATTPPDGIPCPLLRIPLFTAITGISAAIGHTWRCLVALHHHPRFPTQDHLEVIGASADMRGVRRGAGAESVK